MLDDEIPASAMCQNCTGHQATVIFVPDGGILDAMHGSYYYWCECCVLKAQIGYSEKMAARLPQLKADLESACR